MLMKKRGVTCESFPATSQGAQERMIDRPMRQCRAIRKCIYYFYNWLCYLGINRKIDEWHMLVILMVECKCYI